MIKITVSAVVAMLLLTGCPPPNRDLSAAGSSVPMIGSDLAQALPGKPLDRCAIKAHIETEDSFPCLTISDLNNMIRNKAAEVGGNCVIVTTYIRQAECTFGGGHAARGIALSCPEEALRAAALR